MRIHITIAMKPNAELPLPDDRTLAEAGARGMMNLIYSHLVRRNASSTRRAGMPKSDYWADVADSMKVEAAGKVGVVTIDKEGAALHYYGGIVYPTGGRKALAIPLAAEVAGMRPSEWSGFSHGDDADDDDILQLFWPKNSSHGFLKHRDTGELLYLLISRATIKADPSVLPDDAALQAAAEDAIGAIL